MTFALSEHRVSVLLGQGATTQTSLVEDSRGAVVGVLKRLVPRLRGDPEARARLLVEAAVLRSLAGHGSPGLLGRGDDDRGPWLVMEHVPLPTLAELAASSDGAVGRSDLVSAVSAPLLLALAAVHEAADDHGALGVVHGDVSPENLLASPDGSAARLVDFGLASSRDAPPPPPGALRGTALYVAPEVARGEAATAASDVFSLALSLLHTASGEPPRVCRALAPLVAEAGEAPVDAYAARASERLPPALRDVLLACTAFEPARRPASAREAHRRGSW